MRATSVVRSLCQTALTKVGSANHGCMILILQVIVGLLSMTLNLLRDCRLEREEYRVSALIINYFSLGCVFVISTLNVLIAGLDPMTQI